MENLLFLAMSASGGEGQESGLMGMLPFVLIIVVIYFFMIRPQSKKAKKQKEMLSNLKKGDKIISIGGIYGTILSVQDRSFIIQISKGVEMEIDRSSVSTVVSDTETAITK